MFRAPFIVLAMSAAAGIALASRDAVAFGALNEGTDAFRAAIPLDLVRYVRAPRKRYGAMGSFGQFGSSPNIPRSYGGVGSLYGGSGTQRGGWYNRSWGGTLGGPGWGYGFGPNLGGSGLIH